MITPNYTSLDGRIRFYNCDCMELMSSGKVWDLAVVDPPYGISVNMNAGRKKDTKSKKRKNKKWDNETPSQDYFDLLMNVANNQIIFGANHMIDKIKKNSQGWIFWDKCVAEGCTFSDGELAWTSFDRSLKKITSPWSGFIGQEGEKFHPTTKPIKLYRKVLQNYAKVGDTILDTHGGSMSSAIACHMEGFELDICELDKEYFDAAVNRFKIYEQQLTLF